MKKEEIELSSRIFGPSLEKSSVKRSRCFLITGLIALRCVYKSDVPDLRKGERNKNESGCVLIATALLIKFLIM